MNALCEICQFPYDNELRDQPQEHNTENDSMDSCQDHLRS
jgi:hypothetical protein